MITTEQKLLYIQSYMQINKVVIAFSGHSGIGKTTLSEWLAETLHVNYMPEVARMLLPLINGEKIEPECWQKLVVDAYHGMLYKLVLWGENSIVCDRIVQDVYAYCFVTNPKFRNVKNSTEKSYDILITLSDLPTDPTKDHRELTSEQLDSLDKYLKIGQQAVISGGAYHIHLESTDLVERKEQVIHEIYKYIDSKVK